MNKSYLPCHSIITIGFYAICIEPLAVNEDQEEAPRPLDPDPLKTPLRELRSDPGHQGPPASGTSETGLSLVLIPLAHKHHSEERNLIAPGRKGGRMAR